MAPDESRPLGSDGAKLRGTIAELYLGVWTGGGCWGEQSEISTGGDLLNQGETLKILTTTQQPRPEMRMYRQLTTCARRRRRQRRPWAAGRARATEGKERKRENQRSQPRAGAVKL